MAKKEKWAFDPEKLKKIKEKEVKVENIKEINTILDISFSALDNEKREASFSEISKNGLSKESVDKVGRLLEKDKIINVVYPTTPFSEPKIVLLKEIVECAKETPPEKALESYGYWADGIPVNIIVFTDNDQKSYCIRSAEVGKYTKLFIESIKEKIAESFTFDVAELSDAKKSIELKEKFRNLVSRKLKEFVPEFSRDDLSLISGILLHEMYGLGKMELIMADNRLEEVAINSSQNPVTVYHKKYGWLRTNITIGKEEEIANYSAQIARKVGREITVLNPILDAHLLSGDRVSSTLFPISSFGNTITIRRFARKPWTITDLIGESNTLSAEMAAMLWLGTQYEMNVLVAGGTASGKTSMLNVLCMFMPSYHRILSIEDVREITLPSYLKWNWVPLNTREPNPEGAGAVSMLDLLQASLRMRPDRIILGEIRRKEEAEVLFEAMHTGHSVYSTIHANSGKQVVRRLTEPPIELPAIEVEAIDLVVVQYRDRRSNLRRTYEICTVEQGSGNMLDANTIYRWVPRKDSWDKVNEPRKFIEQLNMHTGLTEKEINDEIAQRVKILNWMKEKKVNDLEGIGKAMKRYYANRQEMIEMAEKNKEPSELQ